MSYLFIIVFVIMILPNIAIANIDFPRFERLFPAQSNLLLFLPFDDVFMAQDSFAHIDPDDVKRLRLVTDEPGPYVDLSSKSYSMSESYKSQEPPHYQFPLVKTKNFSSFTVTFHFKATLKSSNETGVFCLSDASTHATDFICLRIYRDPKNYTTILMMITFYLPEADDYFDVLRDSFVQLLLHGENYDVNDKWIYAAVTFSNNQLDIFNKDARLVATVNGVKYTQWNIFDLQISKVWWGGRRDSTSSMSPDDAIACVSVHERVLSADEIREMPNVCETKGWLPSTASVHILGRIAVVNKDLLDYLNLANPKNQLYASLVDSAYQELMRAFANAGFSEASISLSIVGFLQNSTSNVDNSTLQAEFIAVLRNFPVKSADKTVLTKLLSAVESDQIVFDLVSLKSLWPNPASTLAYWPLSETNRTNDLGPNKISADTNQPLTFVYGPFGVENTAITLAGSEAMLNVTDWFSFPFTEPLQSFSLSLIFKPYNESSIGVFRFLHKDNASLEFGFGYRMLTNASIIFVSVGEEEIFSFEVIDTASWKFIAFVYDQKAEIFSIYLDRFILFPEIPIDLMNGKITQQYIGYKMPYNNELLGSISYACLAIHSEALTSHEIRKHYDACRVLSNIPPCGSIESDITKPKFIAALYYEGNHSCSATILNRNWLLTAANCFINTRGRFLPGKDGKNFMLQLPASNEQMNVNPAEIFIQDTESIALIQLQEEIDFNIGASTTNADACLYLDNRYEILQWNADQMLIDWNAKIPSPVLADEVCEELLSPNNSTYIRGQHFCTEVAPDDCVRLSLGSPLLAFIENDPDTQIAQHYVQIGVLVSRNCSESEQPLVYLNVLSRRKWILDQFHCWSVRSDVDTGVNCSNWMEGPEEPTTTGEPTKAPEEIIHSGPPEWLIILLSTLLPTLFFAGVLIVLIIYYKWKKGRWLFQKKSLLAKMDQNHGYLQPVLNFSQLLEANGADKQFQKMIQNLSIAEDNLYIVEEIARGNFGTVSKAILKRSDDGVEEVVAVKSVVSTTAADFTDFLKEAYIMQSFHHENVLSLMGIAVIRDSPYLVVPFMKKGSLKDYLRKHSKRCSINNLNWFSEQVLHGMLYLSSQGCLHRDLACRNILVDQNLSVKISDFGLSRMFTPEQDSYYRSREPDKTLLPVRWHPPESICRHLFVPKSDVWSFGVVLWEIYSLCKTEPYADLQTFEVVVAICVGRRLDRPQLCPTAIYENVMLPCWREMPDDRPSFAELAKAFPMEKISFAL